MNRIRLVVAAILLWGVSAFAQSTPAVDSPRLVLDAFVAEASARGLIAAELASKIRSDWDSVRLGELSGETGLEEGLIARSVARKDLDHRQGEALVRLHLELRAAAVAPLPGQEAANPIDWVALVVRWLPRVGGLAFALGLLLWLLRGLRNASETTQAAAAAVLALGLWCGAYALDRADHTTTAAALVIAGCLASLASVALVHAGRNDAFEALTWGLPVTLIWAVVACALGSSAAALLTALALVVTLGGHGLDRWDRRSTRVHRQTIFAGLALVAAGYAIRGLGVEPMALLVYPFWVVGLCTVFAGSALGWSWRVFDQQSRWFTLGLAVAATLWGLATGQGVFAGAGGVALVIWGLACLVEAIPRRTPDSVKLVVVGAAMLGLTLPLDTHWPLIVEVVSRGP